MWTWVILAIGFIMIVGPIAYFEWQRGKIERKRHNRKMSTFQSMYGRKRE